MKFYYEAHNKWGEPQRGEIEAGSEEDAAGKLRSAGLFAREISGEPIGRPKFETGAVSAGPTQGQVYNPEKDDLSSLEASPPVDERGDPVLPTQEELGSLRMKPHRIKEAGTKVPQKPPMPRPQWIPEGSSKPDPEANPAPRPDPRQPIPAWRPKLARDLAQLSEVLATMGEWSKICNETKATSPLPPGVPSMGGRTWEKIWKNIDPVVQDILKDIIREAVK